MAPSSALACGLIVSALVGCGTNLSGSVSPSTAGPAESAAAEPSPSPTTRTLSFALEPKEGWTAHGTVEIEITGTGYTMTVNMEGLNPNSHHLLNMHAGTCAAQDTELIIPVVQDVAADAEGVATYRQDYPFPYVVPAEGRILTVHGDKPGNEIFTHIACTELTN